LDSLAMLALVSMSPGKSGKTFYWR
jgi:hypothetical protein